jgi:citrate lyase subunit beta/citryl-CoA lyase
LIVNLTWRYVFGIRAKLTGILRSKNSPLVYSFSLGVPPVPEALEHPCRMIAMAAARRGYMAIGLPVSISTIDDRGAWERGVQAGRAFGMTSALCIHPDQVGPANRGFEPSSSELAAARRILNAWEAAGGAGVTQLDGKMIDRPVALAAARLLSRSPTHPASQ